MMLGILAASARGEDNSTAGGETQAPAAGGGETQAPPAGGGETQAPPAGGGETQAPPATETPPPAAPPAGAPQESNNIGNATASQGGNNITAADFVNTILAIHNRERAAVGVPPLVWSDTLAAGAKPWAEHVAQINQMVHSTGAERPGQVSQGENIASTGY